MDPKQDRYDRIAKLLMEIYDAGMWKASVSKRAVEVDIIRAFLYPNIKLEVDITVPDPECTGRSVHGLYGSMLYQVGLDEARSFFHGRDAICSGEDGKKCEYYRREVHSRLVKKMNEYDAILKDWSTRHKEIDKAQEMVDELARPVDLGDEVIHLVSGLEDENTLLRAMIFAHQRKLRELESRLEKVEIENPAKRKSCT